MIRSGRLNVGRPASYRCQNGCHDCHWCVKICDYDDAPTRYCRRGAPRRPLCGSVAMNESFFYRRLPRSPKREAIEYRRMEDWRAWSEGREVESYGMCDHWRQAREAGRYARG